MPHARRGCSLRHAVCAAIDRSRCVVPGSPTGSGTTMTPYWFPCAGPSEGSCKDTGTMARSTRSATFSPRDCRRSRRPSATAASTASFTVPPAPWAASFTRSRRLRTTAMRRARPIGRFKLVRRVRRSARGCRIAGQARRRRAAAAGWARYDPVPARALAYHRRLSASRSRAAGAGRARHSGAAGDGAAGAWSSRAPSSDGYLAGFFASVQPVATLSNPAGIHNQEWGGRIYLCTGPISP